MVEQRAGLGREHVVVEVEEDVAPAPLDAVLRSTPRARSTSQSMFSVEAMLLWSWAKVPGTGKASV